MFNIIVDTGLEMNLNDVVVFSISLVDQCDEVHLNITSIGIVIFSS